MKLSRYIFALTVSTASLQLSAQNVQRYNVHILMPNDNWLSGIAIVKKDSTESTMSVINEFGIKLFDARYRAREGQTRLYNVIRPIGKRHIRKTIAQDVTLLFDTKQKSTKVRTITAATDGTITITNKRYNINYTLIPIDGCY